MIVDKFRNQTELNTFSINDIIINIKPISLSQKLFIKKHFFEIIKNNTTMLGILKELLPENEYERIFHFKTDALQTIMYFFKMEDLDSSIDFYFSESLKKIEAIEKSIAGSLIKQLMLLGYKYSELKDLSEEEIVEYFIIENKVHNENFEQTLHKICVELELTETLSMLGAVEKNEASQKSSAYNQINQL